MSEPPALLDAAGNPIPPRQQPAQPPAMDTLERQPYWDSHRPGIGPWSHWNWWQMHGVGPRASELHPVVEACVGRTTEVIAMMPVHHYRRLANGALERVPNSRIERILRKPNSYQNSTDFFLNLLRCEMLQGNGYAVRLRRPSGRDRLHLVHPRRIDIVVTQVGYDIEVFYRLDGNGAVQFDRDILVPARDMIHLRKHCPRSPLVGETPLMAAALAIDAGMSINAHQSRFFSNMSRPSGVLSTQEVLTASQLSDIRKVWEEQTTRMESGHVPILAGGIKFEKMQLSAADAQIVDVYKLGVQDIARVYGVPLAVIGDMEGSNYDTTETLIRHWIATSLGYALHHIEQALEDVFGLDRDPDQLLRYDTEVLLRAEFKERIEALARGVQAGVFSPNEARRREGLAPVEHGEEPRVQQQVVPLSFAYEQQQQAALPAPAPPEDDEDEDEDEDNAEAERSARRVYAFAVRTADDVFRRGSRRG